MKKFLLLFLAVLFYTATISACGGGQRPTVTTPPTANEELLAQFGPVESDPVVPLEEVVVPAPEPPDTATARTYRLLQGQLAPVPGILFTDGAAAYIVTEYGAIRERFQLALGQQRERDQVRLFHDTEALRLRMNGDRERFRLIFAGQAQYIQTLERLVESTANSGGDFWNSFWKISGAAGIGIIVGIVIGFIAGFSL